MKPSSRMGATEKVKPEFTTKIERASVGGVGKSTLNTPTTESVKVSILSASATSIDKPSRVAVSSPAASTTKSAASEGGVGKNKTVGTAGLDNGFSGRNKVRTKSIIILDKKPMAVLMEHESATQSEADEKTSVSSVPVVTIKPAHHPPNQETKLEEPSAVVVDQPPNSDVKHYSHRRGKTGIGKRRRSRTFRIWAPNEDRKSIVVQVGDDESHEEAEKIFQSAHMRHKNYHQWQRQAKAQLPSVTGGPPVNNVADIINAAPTLQNEANPRIVQETIKKLSWEKDKKNLFQVPPPEQNKKRTSVKTDYTKIRVVAIPEPPRVQSPVQTLTSIPAESHIPKPTAIPVSKPAPDPVPKPVSVPKPAPVPDPVPKPDPVPDPVPKPAPVPDPVPKPSPVPVPKPSPVPVPPPEPPALKPAPYPPDVEDEVEDEEEVKDEDDDDDDDDDDDYGYEEYMAIDVDDTSDCDEERRLEKERHEAGIAIKNKIKAIRELAEHLSEKRKIRRDLIENATGFTLMDTEQIPMKEQLLYIIEDVGDYLRDTIDRLTIWDKGIKEINGRFGVVIASYFIWLRNMIYVELLFFVITNVFIIIPQAVEDVQNPPPQIKRRAPFKITNLINGEGWFHYSFLYYSGYHARHENGSNPFKDPAFRFIFCILIMFFIMTYFIFSRLTRYYSSVRMESKVSGVAHMENFKSIICGWDFSCRDDQAKIYLHRTIVREMKYLVQVGKTRRETLMNFELKGKRILRYAVTRLGFYRGAWAVHIAGNLLLLVACIILGTILLHLCKLKLFYYVNCVADRDDNIHRDLHHKFLCPNGNTYLDTWILSLPALFASMATLLLTKFILIVGDNEIWNTPERKIYAAMVRAGLFYFTNIFVFYLYWISQKPVLRTEGFVPETIFGKELYRLVVIQGIMDVVLNFGVKFIYHMFKKKRKRNYKKTEFRTEYCSLSMFYIHSVSRIGTLFCPPLSIFVTLRFVMDYYQNRYSLLHMSAQDSYNAHASQVYAPFLLTFFIFCYLITSFMNVYYIAETMPSIFNGPFVKYNNSYDQVLGMLLESKEGTNWLRNFAHPSMLAVFLIILTALVYFCRKWARTFEPIMEHLNAHIKLERADRDLLLKAIFEIGQVAGDEQQRLKKMTKSNLLESISGLISSGEVSEESEESEPIGAGDQKRTSVPNASSRKSTEQIVDKKVTEVLSQLQGRKTLNLRASVTNPLTSGRLSGLSNTAPQVQFENNQGNQDHPIKVLTRPSRVSVTQDHPIKALVRPSLVPGAQQELAQLSSPPTTTNTSPTRVDIVGRSAAHPQQSESILTHRPLRSITFSADHSKIKGQNMDVNTDHITANDVEERISNIINRVKHRRASRGVTFLSQQQQQQQGERNRKSSFSSATPELLAKQNALQAVETERQKSLHKAEEEKRKSLHKAEEEKLKSLHKAAEEEEKRKVAQAAEEERRHVEIERRKTLLAAEQEKQRQIRLAQEKAEKDRQQHMSHVLGNLLKGRRQMIKELHPTERISRKTSVAPETSKHTSKHKVKPTMENMQLKHWSVIKSAAATMASSSKQISGVPPTTPNTSRQQQAHEKGAGAGGANKNLTK